MTTAIRSLIGLSAVFLASACALPQGAERTPQLSTENACYVAPASHSCRLSHDLAGGFPITRGGGGS